MREFKLMFQLGDLGITVVVVDEVINSKHPVGYLSVLILDALEEVDQRRSKEMDRLRDQVRRRTQFIMRYAPQFQGVVDQKDIHEALR